MLETIATILILVAIAILPFALLDVAARLVGVDGRGSVGDDRRS